MGESCIFYQILLRVGISTYQRARAAEPRMRDLEVIDSELRLVAARRRAATEREARCRR
jgi:hypothetical protein